MTSQLTPLSTIQVVVAFGAFQVTVVPFWLIAVLVISFGQLSVSTLCEPHPELMEVVKFPQSDTVIKSILWPVSLFTAKMVA